MSSAGQHLQLLGTPAFKLWVYLCRQAQTQGVDEITVPLSELSRSSGVVSEEGGSGLGPVRAALRRLVSAHYVTAAPEKERRCRILLLRRVDIR